MKRYFVTILAALGWAGCAGEQYQYSWITHTWTTPAGVFAEDHVSHDRIDVSKAVRRNYLGETYYFTSEEDAKVFDSNPWAYLYVDNARSPRPDRADMN